MALTKVLIVDDEIEFASALAERLLIRDYDARAVCCADEVIKAAKAESPHVVLLDLKMPGVNGLDVLKELKQIRPEVQVIILTGHGDPNMVRSGMDGGAFDFIMKPVEIETLLTKIDQARAAAEKTR